MIKNSVTERYYLHEVSNPISLSLSPLSVNKKNLVILRLPILLFEYVGKVRSSASVLALLISAWSSLYVIRGVVLQCKSKYEKQ